MGRLAAAHVDTPVGPLLALASDRGLCGLPFLSHRFTPAAELDGAPDPAVARSRVRLDGRLRRWFGDADIVEAPDDPVIRQTRAWLDAYFGGAPPLPELPPLDMRGADFERTVWTALLDIPIGATTSYGEIAKRLGNPKASRAVGLANGANPVPIIVPCHRVIGASGALTGYGGGLPRKTWLLQHEQKHWGRDRTLF